MDGEATFSPIDAGCLSYREQGRVRMEDGQAFDAERQYIFRPAPDGFSVFFAEPSEPLFHTVALHELDVNLIGDTTHHCIDDDYTSHYEFRADGTFVVRHKVFGPRKNYLLETRYLGRFF